MILGRSELLVRCSALVTWDSVKFVLPLTSDKLLACGALKVRNLQKSQILERD